MRPEEREELERRAAETAARLREKGVYDLLLSSPEQEKIIKVYVTNEKSGFSAFCWVLTIIGCILSVLTIGIGLMIAQSAPQEAVVVSIGLALAIVPYCFAKAVSELSGK